MIDLCLEFFGIRWRCPSWHLLLQLSLMLIGSPQPPQGLCDNFTVYSIHVPLDGKKSYTFTDPFSTSWVYMLWKDCRQYSDGGITIHRVTLEEYTCTSFVWSLWVSVVRMCFVTFILSKCGEVEAQYWTWTVECADASATFFTINLTTKVRQINHCIVMSKFLAKCLISLLYQLMIIQRHCCDVVVPS
jgi:hypothetical protein